MGEGRGEGRGPLLPTGRQRQTYFAVPTPMSDTPYQTVECAVMIVGVGYRYEAYSVAVRGPEGGGKVA